MHTFDSMAQKFQLQVSVLPSGRKVVRGSGAEVHDVAGCGPCLVFPLANIEERVRRKAFKLAGLNRVLYKQAKRLKELRLQEIQREIERDDDAEFRS